MSPADENHSPVLTASVPWNALSGAAAWPVRAANAWNTGSKAPRVPARRSDSLSTPSRITARSGLCSTARRTASSRVSGSFVTSCAAAGVAITGKTMANAIARARKCGFGIMISSPQTPAGAMSGALVRSSRVSSTTATGTRLRATSM